jgi:murein DD-endopeptidase MepM/ murein hydrolase activator NlpD
VEPQKVTNENPETAGKTKRLSWTSVLSWVLTLLVTAVLLAVYFQFNPFKKTVEAATEESPAAVTEVPLPAYVLPEQGYSLERPAEPDTTIPEGSRQYPIKYTVEPGDSIFAIAEKFDLKPESILWANYDLLNDDPTYLAPGWQLTIPPTDGIYYQLKEGDTLAKVAEKYKANPEDIISWPANKLDVTKPDTNGLEYVMIPGGSREITSWIKPLEYTSGSGATRVIAGGCQAAETGYVGTGSFIWPTYNHFLSGFDFSSYHLAIDIAALEGTPIVASDSGTVIYAAWNNTGYGNLIVISHRNGYETLYAHLSSIAVYCGEDVVQGQYIGAAGNTGKSTGSHLHFEIRLNGGFVNPWSVLGP